MASQREIDRARELREKEFARARAKAERPASGSTVILPKKRPLPTRRKDPTYN